MKGDDLNKKSRIDANNKPVKRSMGVKPAEGGFRVGKSRTVFFAEINFDWPIKALSKPVNK